MKYTCNYPDCRAPITHGEYFHAGRRYFCQQHVRNMHGGDCPDPCNVIVAEAFGALAERARIVRYLRERAEMAASWLASVADDIEEGN